MSVSLIDCHAHLADTAYDDDREQVLERARRAGVAGVVTVGEDLDDARRILDLSDRHPELLPAAGLYPTRLDLDAADAMERWIRDHRARLVGIGEVGLDYWKVQDPAEREVQREIFLRFVRLSIELDLPLNIHSRSAGRPVIELLLELGARRVQLHCFDGRAATAQPAVDAGYFFSIPPSVAAVRQKQKLVRRLPLSCLLVETDSPLMAPVRGERNEPANAVLPVRSIAELKGLAEQEVREAVAANATRLYGDL